jgi:hypothetical protein
MRQRSSWDFLSYTRVFLLQVDEHVAPNCVFPSYIFMHKNGFFSLYFCAQNGVFTLNFLDKNVFLGLNFCAQNWAFPS